MLWRRQRPTLVSSTTQRFRLTGGSARQGRPSGCHCPGRIRNILKTTLAEPVGVSSSVFLGGGNGVTHWISKRQRGHEDGSRQHDRIDPVEDRIGFRRSVEDNQEQGYRCGIQK